jgi:hypothetical protein
MIQSLKAEGENLFYDIRRVPNKGNIHTATILIVPCPTGESVTRCAILKEAPLERQ